MNKQRLTKTKIFLGLFVVSIFLCNLLSDNLLQSNLRFMEDRENPLDENHIEIEKKAKGINSFETPKYSSGYPQFETALTTDNFYISPKNMDGVKDSLNISFEVDRDAYFNL